MSQSDIQSLLQREAVANAFYRLIAACDRNDAQAFESAWIGEDVNFEINDTEKKVIPGLSMLRTHVLQRVGPMDTTHSLSMVRVDLKDGAETASLTATSMAQHCPPGKGREPDAPKFMVGGEYSADFIKNEAGAWKIKKCALNVVWNQGDASVMRGPH